MFDARNIENAGTFDATNTTNFGAKSGSWREAFGYCISLKRLYIKNLKVSLNISWSPIDYDSIYYIISAAANTNAITISVSPYTYNLLSTSDFELATSKNITIALITTNYVEDRRLSAITITGDGSKVLSDDGTYKVLPTKTSQLENDSNFLTEHQSLENYVTKDDAFSGDYNDLTNAPDIAEDDSGDLVINDNVALITKTGDGWFAGDVYVGSTDGLTKDEGSKKLATEEFVANSIAEEAITWGTFG